LTGATGLERFVEVFFAGVLDFFAGDFFATVDFLEMDFLETVFFIAISF
jgi:hypothetical protein